VRQITSDGEILPVCNTTVGYCLIDGWCPLEQDNLNHTKIINGLESVTVFMRSSVSYDTFGIQVADPTDPIDGVNLYNLTDMLGGTTIKNCSTTGCIISVAIDWTCNLDVMGCSPNFQFTFVPGGFNFRDVTYTIGQTDRNLMKRYGIRFFIKLTGTGGMFTFFRTVIAVGSGVVFLTVSTIITDFILLTVIYPNNENFIKTKYYQYTSVEQE